MKRRQRTNLDLFGHVHDLANVWIETEHEALLALDGHLGHHGAAEQFRRDVDEHRIRFRQRDAGNGQVLLLQGEVGRRRMWMLGPAPAKTAHEAPHEDLAGAIGFVVGRSMVGKRAKFCSDEPIRGPYVVCALEGRGCGRHATSEGKNELDTYEDVNQCILAATKVSSQAISHDKQAPFGSNRVRVRISKEPKKSPPSQSGRSGTGKYLDGA